MVIPEIVLSVQTCRNPVQAGNGDPRTGRTFSILELDELSPDRDDAGHVMTVEGGALEKGQWVTKRRWNANTLTTGLT
jgi:hypothetical protein